MTENPCLEEIEYMEYPINDVLLSSTSAAINISAPPSIRGNKAAPNNKPKGRTTTMDTRRNYTRSSASSSTQAVASVSQVMEISGLNCVKDESLPAAVTPENLTKSTCPLCNKHFVHIFALKRHLASHNSQVYSCDQCNKSFKHHSTMVGHRASHSKSLPFTCDICQKSFNRISTMKSHRRIHSGSKPFVCHVCNKGFHQKGNLKNHLYIHTNERPYRCEICSQGFNQMSNLVCHKKNAHRIMASVFFCPYCEMQFKSAGNQRKHEIEVHLQPTDFMSVETETQLVRVQTFVGSSPPVGLVEKMEQEEEEEMIFELYKDDIKEEIVEGVSDNPIGVGDPNCQMIFERTEHHCFFSKFSVIELPQKIDTLEMRYAELANKVPFAMLHFGADAPCLVQIVEHRGVSVLKPIKKHELSKITFSEPDPLDQRMSNKIVITIVATIYQTFAKGVFSLFTVRSPEIVRYVKLLVDNDPDGAIGRIEGGSLLNFSHDTEDLQALQNKITIALSDSKMMTPPLMSCNKLEAF